MTGRMNKFNTLETESNGLSKAHAREMSEVLESSDYNYEEAFNTTRSQYWETLNTMYRPVYKYLGDVAELRDALEYLDLPAVGDSNISCYIMYGTSVWVVDKGANPGPLFDSIFDGTLHPSYKMNGDYIFQNLLNNNNYDGYTIVLPQRETIPVTSNYYDYVFNEWLPKHLAGNGVPLLWRDNWYLVNQESLDNTAKHLLTERKDLLVWSGHPAAIRQAALEIICK